MAHAGESLMDPEEVEASLRRLRHRRMQEATDEQRLERLTPRELEILQLIADGVSSDQIAPTLGISPHTLRTHLQKVLTKLKVHSKLDAVVLAIRHGKIVANLEGESPEAIGAEIVDVAALEAEQRPGGRGAPNGNPGWRSSYHSGDRGRRRDTSTSSRGMSAANTMPRWGSYSTPRIPRSSTSSRGST